MVKRWMSCRPMNGPTLGWLAKVSKARVSACGPLSDPEMAVPKTDLSPDWKLAALCFMGRVTCA